MDNLFTTYNRLIEQTSLAFKRHLYDLINWDNRLISIRGAKGIGKTTMVLQHIKEAYPNPEKAFYASVDNIWFGSHTILSLAEYLYTHGVEALFLDEVHKYPNWRQEVKNIYDSYPGFKVVITGSSMLQLTSSAIGDLSRRARLYTMKGLSFREFLNYEYGVQYSPIPLQDILARHVRLAREIAEERKVLPIFERYLQCGYYPFYKEEGDGFLERLLWVIDTIIEAEIPAIGRLEYSSVYKIRQLLSILAERTPYTLNISELSRLIQVSRDSIIKLLHLMEQAALTINIYTANGFKALAKPEKILFENPNIMQALSPKIDLGTLRETFFASQMSGLHKMLMPDKGDFIIDDKWLFEVGGAGKGFNQIKDVPESYVVADGIESGYGNKIPLWLFGFLY